MGLNCANTYAEAFTLRYVVNFRVTTQLRYRLRCAGGVIWQIQILNLFKLDRINAHTITSCSEGSSSSSGNMDAKLVPNDMDIFKYSSAISLK